MMTKIRVHRVAAVLAACVLLMGAGSACGADDTGDTVRKTVTKTVTVETDTDTARDTGTQTESAQPVQPTTTAVTDSVKPKKDETNPKRDDQFVYIVSTGTETRWDEFVENQLWKADKSGSLTPVSDAWHSLTPAAARLGDGILYAADDGVWYKSFGPEQGKHLLNRPMTPGYATSFSADHQHAAIFAAFGEDGESDWHVFLGDAKNTHEVTALPMREAASLIQQCQDGSVYTFGTDGSSEKRGLFVETFSGLNGGEKKMTHTLLLKEDSMFPFRALHVNCSTFDVTGVTYDQEWIRSGRGVAPAGPPGEVTRGQFLTEGENPFSLGGNDQYAVWTKDGVLSILDMDHVETPPATYPMTANKDFAYLINIDNGYIAMVSLDDNDYQSVTLVDMKDPTCQEVVARGFKFSPFKRIERVYIPNGMRLNCSR